MALTANLKRTGLAARLEAQDERDRAEKLSEIHYEPVQCLVCGGAVEETPMKKDTCYDCYRDQLEKDNLRPFEVEAWKDEAIAENLAFVSRIGGADLYICIESVKQSIKEIRERYEASIDHSNDKFWEARRKW